MKKLVTILALFTMVMLTSFVEPATSNDAKIKPSSQILEIGGKGKEIVKQLEIGGKGKEIVMHKEIGGKGKEIV